MSADPNNHHFQSKDSGSTGPHSENAPESSAPSAMKQPMQLRWHYTTVPFLRLILLDQAIKQATIGVEPGEKPAVWFSSNQTWEETANKGMVTPYGETVRLNKEQTHKRAGGLARVGVEPDSAPNDWNAFKRLGGIRPEEARRLYVAGLMRGARPGEWFCSFEPVPADKWVAIEVWDGEAWVPVDETDASPS
jgi:hypothetical protein